MIKYIINMIIYIIIFNKTVRWYYLFIIIFLAYINDNYIGNTWKQLQDVFYEKMRS